MKRAVIYSRVSKKHQDYRRQIIDLKKFAKGKYQIDYEKEIFAEPISATRQGKEFGDRAVFMEMKAYLKESGIKEILIWDVSRFARNTANALAGLEELKRDKINVFFWREKLGSLNEDNWMHIGIHCVVAEREARDLSARVKSGRKRSASEGTVSGYYGQNLPYGYESAKYSTGRLVLEKWTAHLFL